jgi:hypothetical protein
MLEVALLILVAGGSLWMMSRRLLADTSRLLPLDKDEWDEQTLSPIAGGGLYNIAKPGEIIAYTGFSDLQLVKGGLTLRDNRDGQTRFIHFALMQWVSAITFANDGTAQITIHLEVNQQWRLLNLRLAENDMRLLVKVLQRVISPARLNIGRLHTNPIGPIAARTVDENLQGEITLGAEVGLYILPHMLLVLHNDTVQAKLDTSTIRRVLSVERVSGKLDSILHPNTPDGIVRLYALYESAAFALPQYRELAEELAYLSRCPIEFIVQGDKEGKR